MTRDQALAFVDVLVGSKNMRSHLGAVLGYAGVPNVEDFSSSDAKAADRCGQLLGVLGMTFAELNAIHKARPKQKEIDFEREKKKAPPVSPPAGSIDPKELKEIEEEVEEPLKWVKDGPNSERLVTDDTDDEDVEGEDVTVTREARKKKEDDDWEGFLDDEKPVKAPAPIVHHPKAVGVSKPKAAARPREAVKKKAGKAKKNELVQALEQGIAALKAGHGKKDRRQR